MQRYNFIMVPYCGYILQPCLYPVHCALSVPCPLHMYSESVHSHLLCTLYLYTVICVCILTITHVPCHLCLYPDHYTCTLSTTHVFCICTLSSVSLPCPLSIILSLCICTMAAVHKTPLATVKYIRIKILQYYLIQNNVYLR